MFINVLYVLTRKIEKISSTLIFSNHITLSTVLTGSGRTRSTKVPTVRLTIKPSPPSDEKSAGHSGEKSDEKSKICSDI